MIERAALQSYTVSFAPLIHKEARAQMRREIVLFAIAVIAVFGLGAALVFVAETYGHGGARTRGAAALGDALIIAACLAATVDLFVKQRLVGDAVRDMLPAILGHLVPEEFKDEIRQISNYEIVRQQLKLTYRLRERPPEAEGLEMHLLVEYRVLNISARNQQYTHHLWVEKYPGPEALVQIPRVGSTGATASKDGIPTRLEGGEWGMLTEDGRALRYQKQFLIAPNKDFKKAPRFWGEIVQILPIEYQDVFQLVSPTIGVEIEVDAPNWLEVEVTFGHPEKRNRIELGPNHWELPVGFSAYSTVWVVWRKTRKPAVLLTTATHGGTSGNA